MHRKKLELATKTEDFIIRDVEIADLAMVYRMLLELVREEKTEQKFKLSLAKMVEYLFGRTADWFCLVAQDLREKTLKGTLLYSVSNTNRAFHISPHVYIDHLYVKPEYRNSGVGAQLMNALKHRAEKSGICRLEVWCMKSNAIGNRFYQKLQLDPVDYINVYRFRSDENLNEESGL